MPAVGGLKIPHPKEKLDQAKTLYLDGKPWKEIAAVTGIHADVLMQKASVQKWTALKARNKAEEQLATLRPHLHKHLRDLTGSVVTPKTANPAKLQQVANLVLTLANATKLVEGWRDEEQSTLVNVLQISTSVTANPPKQLPVGIDPAIDVEASPGQSMLNPGSSAQESEG